MYNKVMDDYDVKTTISDLQINRETWVATIGVIIIYTPKTLDASGELIKCKPEKWTRAYSLKLDKPITLEQFSETIREHVRRDIMIEENVKELNAIKGKPFNLFVKEQK